MQSQLKGGLRLLLCAVALAQGCGGAEEALDLADAAIDASAPDATSCTANGFAAATQTAERDDDLGVFFYTAATSGSEERDMLTVDFYFPLGASDGVQTFALGAGDFTECHTCVLLKQGCSATSCILAASLVPLSGQLAVGEMGPIGQSFIGTITDATFAEATVNFETMETTFVPNGQHWCIDSYNFMATVGAP